MFWSTRKTTELSFQFENVHLHPTAEIGEDVEIGPFSFIGPNCRIGDGCRLHNNVSLTANTVLGKENEVWAGAVLGGEPQDKKYAGEESWVVIGDGNRIRENVTVHGGTAASGGRRRRGVTRVGNRNLLMAGCHVAHDCEIEDDVVLANNVLLGGHVKVERSANLGGQAAVHHFVTIGRSAFVGGLARVGKDVPPFMLVEGNPLRVWTVNKVGLKRQGFGEQEIRDLKLAHRFLYRSRKTLPEAIQKIEDELGDREHVVRLLEFLRRTEAGHQGRARQPYACKI